MEFVEIFTQMNCISAVLLIVGALFMVVEMFVSGFGFFGISGIISIIAGVVVRICQGLNLTQSLSLILIVLGFFVLVVMLLIYGAQYGILGKTGLFERRTTLSQDFSKTDKKIRKLVGKSGKAISNIDLAGKAKIKGKVYDVQSTMSYIEKGSNLKVVEIKDNTIMVRKWFE